MGFTLDTRYDSFIIGEIELYEFIDIPEARNYPYNEQNQGKLVPRVPSPVQVAAQVQPAEHHNHHGNADAAGIGHLDQRFLIISIHQARRLLT